MRMFNMLQLRNRERVQQDNPAERERLIKGFEEMLPERVYLETASTGQKINEDDVWDTKKHGDDTVCCICFEMYADQENSRVRQTPCGHIFHS